MSNFCNGKHRESYLIIYITLKENSWLVSFLCISFNKEDKSEATENLSEIFLDPAVILATTSSMSLSFLSLKKELPKAEMSNLCSFLYVQFCTPSPSAIIWLPGTPWRVCLRSNQKQRGFKNCSSLNVLLLYLCLNLLLTIYYKT